MPHSKFPPSSAHEWVHCPGWVAMHEGLTDTDTEESVEGTVAHDLGAQAIRQATHQVSMVGNVQNGVLVTQEMQDAVDVYIRHCVNLMRTHAIFAGPHLGVESLLRMPSIHQEAFGTCDFWLYTGSTLHVVDFKYGHVSVEAYENWQLIMYTCGILEQLKVNGLQDQAISVVITIIQPRCFTKPEIDTWRVKASDLRGYFNRLATAANNPGAPISGDHCHYCKARLRCTACIERTLWLSEVVDRIGLSNGQVGKLYTLLVKAEEAVKSMLDAVEPEVTARITRGESVSGWSLQPSQGRLGWTVPQEEILAFTDMMGVDIRKPGIMTPTQAIKAGLDEVLIKQFAQRPESLKLTSTENCAKKLGFTPTGKE